jgi:hypothetical protein
MSAPSHPNISFTGGEVCAVFTHYSCEQEVCISQNKTSTGDEGQGTYEFVRVCVGEIRLFGLWLDAHSVTEVAQ